MSKTSKLNFSKKEIVLFIAISLSSLVVMTDMAIIPIANSLYEAFPKNILVVNFIITGPSLLLAATALITGIVLKYISKKNILIFCGSLFTISLLACSIINSPYLIAVLRAIAGVMAAFINVAAMGTLTELFPDDEQRGWLIGFYNSISSGMGMVLSFGSGILAVSDWHHSFWMFLIAIPMVLGFIFILPKDKVVRLENEVQQEKISSEKFKPSFYIILLDMVLFFTCYGAMTYFVSVYVAENSLGNETFTGTITSISLAIGIIVSLLFGYIYAKLKRKTVIMGFLLLTISIVLRYMFPVQSIAIIGESIGVIAYTIVYSYAYVEIPLIVPPSKVNVAIGLITFVYSTGNFICTYIVTSLQKLLYTSSYMKILPIVAICSILPIILEIFIIHNEKKSTI